MRKNIVRSLSKNKELLVSVGARLLDVNCTSIYYHVIPVSGEELECKADIDRLHTDNPTWGSRLMSDELKVGGFNIGRKRVRMNLSKHMKQAKVCPYLLRNAISQGQTKHGRLTSRIFRLSTASSILRQLSTGTADASSAGSWMTPSTLAWL